jgi:CheY-like chemotaxis protein
MATAEKHSVLQHSRVLIVSSDAAFRTQWIGNPHYDAADMEEAAGGADALEKLETENWGEVLLDRKLRDLDVGEVISIIRLRHPHLRLCLVGDPTALASTILLCSSPARFHWRRILESFLPRVVVLSPAEIPASVSVQSLGGVP